MRGHVGLAATADNRAASKVTLAICGMAHGPAGRAGDSGRDRRPRQLGGCRAPAAPISAGRDPRAGIPGIACGRAPDRADHTPPVAHRGWPCAGRAGSRAAGRLRRRHVRPARRAGGGPGARHRARAIRPPPRGARGGQLSRRLSRYTGRTRAERPHPRSDRERAGRRGPHRPVVGFDAAGSRRGRSPPRGRRQSRLPVAARRAAGAGGPGGPRHDLRTHQYPAPANGVSGHRSAASRSGLRRGCWSTRSKRSCWRSGPAAASRACCRIRPPTIWPPGRWFGCWRPSSRRRCRCNSSHAAAIEWRRRSGPSSTTRRRHCADCPRSGATRNDDAPTRRCSRQAFSHAFSQIRSLSRSKPLCGVWPPTLSECASR